MLVLMIACFLGVKRFLPCYVSVCLKLNLYRAVETEVNNFYLDESEFPRAMDFQH